MVADLERFCAPNGALSDNATRNVYQIGHHNKRISFYEKKGPLNTY
jgi:hypothetical protein